MTHFITSLQARQLLDSRGNPTIEVQMFSENLQASAIVPSGASTGEHEALELRDKDPKKFLGKGVLQACQNIITIIQPAICNFELSKQAEFDNFLIELDSTPNKANLGANAILACSMAYARLSALSQNIPLFKYLSPDNTFSLPTPMMNVINGGQHADSGLEIQEFMIFPVGLAPFSEQLRAGVEIFHTLKKLLHKAGYSTAVGDEGGFAPQLPSNEAALDLLIEAITQAGYTTDQVKIALDVAASEFYSPETQTYQVKVQGTTQNLTSAQLITYYQQLIENYPIVSLEDGLDENDWEGWQQLTSTFKNKIQLVGDDLLVTSTRKLQQAIETQACNSILIKLNQIGTVTETLQAIVLAHSANFTAVVSHRSGETEDTFIADLAVGLNTKQIKTGSLSRTDRVAKYNQLLRISEQLPNNRPQ